MNEKQAREILNCKSTGGCPHSTGDIVKAEGYLEAIEKAKRILVEALKNLADGNFHNCGTSDYDSCQCEVKFSEEALAQWEKER